MLNVMIIGCGGISPAHIEGYLNCSVDVKIAVLADGNTKRAEELKEKYDLKTAIIVKDYKEALENVDVVSVCVPPALHAEIAITCLENDCHVLLEKPMAPSLEECDRIIDTAKKNDKLISVIVQSRFISNIRNTIDMVKSEKYGKLLYSRANSVWYRGQSYYDLEWRGRWEIEGGGCTQNHSIHHIDLILWSKGMPKYVNSFMTNLNHTNSEEEDFSSSVLQYEDGSVAEITSSLVSHGEDQTLVFQMEKGGLKIPFDAFASKSRENGFPMDDNDMKKEIVDDFNSRAKLEYENHTGHINNFLKAIAGEEELIAKAEDGRNCIELISGIYKSATTHNKVEFPISKTDDFYSNKWRKNAPHFNEKHKDVAAFKDTSVTNFKDKF